MSRIIVKGIPKNVSEKDLMEHFSNKGEITDVKIMKKKDGNSRHFAFLGFKTEEQAQTAIKYYNNTYLRTTKIQVEQAKVQGDPRLESKKLKIGKKQEIEVLNQSKESKVKKLLEIANLTSTKNKFDTISQKISTVTGTEVEPVSSLAQLNPEKIDPKRLYLRNLPFKAIEEDIKKTFEKFGEVTEIHMPRIYKNNQPLGYAYISFATVESSVLALSEMDKKYFMGRTLHITPAKVKEEKENNNKQVFDKGSDYKTKKYEKLKDNYNDETNWNYLFMNQNAVIENISKKLGIPKNEIMSKDNANLAVQVAAMETAVINETKEWLVSQGINLDSLRIKKRGCLRSKTTILIKNISPNIDKNVLESNFSRYGMLVRFLLSPSNTLGIAEFVDSKHAFNCIKKLAYYEIDNLPLYLEFAPEELIKSNSTTNTQVAVSNTTTDLSEIDLKQGEGKILFITNLNFQTKENSISKYFTDAGYKPVKVKLITHKNEAGYTLSSGYGFVEFDSDKVANKVVRSLQGGLLDGHSIKLNIAKSTEKKKMLGNKRKAETELNDYEYEGELVDSTKILVKNLAFETNKDELRQLFKTYGEVKTVRMPQKLDGTHRGFGFIDFVTADEAKASFKSLQNSHFYGRKLVLEWAKKDKDLDELREQTERKVKASNIQTHRKQNKSEFNYQIHN